jgi:acyl-ACP thioesterase
MNSRVRFSETDKDRKITLGAIVDYFQDCSTFQSEDLGVGFSYLKPMNLAWVLSYWQIVVAEYPMLGENIRVSTLPYNFKGFLGSRNFIMENEAGKRVAWANSLWTLLDMGKGFPKRPTEEILKAYPVEEKIEMDYESRKIAVSGEEQRKEPLVVREHHLDCNGHVNNGQYIKMAQNFLPEDFAIHQMRAEYRMQAMLGDRIYPSCYVTEDKFTVCLKNEEDKPYTIIEFAGGCTE